MIKVFTTDKSPYSAGNDLTSQFENWQKTFDMGKPIKIISVHTNSNKYGWMLTVVYEL